MPRFVLAVGLFFCAVFATGQDSAVLDREKLKMQLVIHEGKQAKVYKDTEGILTVGVGFNLRRRDAKQKIEALNVDFEKLKSGRESLTDHQIDQLLEDDIDAAIRDCKSLIPNLANLSDVRQRVLIDMTFNLGKTRLSKFRKMIAAVKAEDFNEAAEEMKDSKWYTQVRRRGKHLTSMMKANKDVIRELVDGK